MNQGNEKISNSEKYIISETSLRECMARAYCHKENETKELDATLIESMIREIKDACNKSDGHNEADTEAEEMAENLKCCGNCKHYHAGGDVPCLEWHHWNE